MDSDKSTFVYSVNWVEFIFSSKEATGDLLSLERESGNLTSADYEKALDFLPRAKYYGYQPLGGLILCTLSAALGIQHRKPRWVNLQKASVAVSLGIAGYAIGKVSMLKAHAKFLRSLENPRGFAEAIRNIESRSGLHNHQTRGPKFTSVWADNNTQEGISFEKSALNVFPVNDTAKDTHQFPRRAQSKWDEIRMANSNASNSTAWDKLRQKHEKGAVISQNRIQQSPGPADKVTDFEK